MKKDNIPNKKKQQKKLNFNVIFMNFFNLNSLKYISFNIKNYVGILHKGSLTIPLFFRVATSARDLKAKKTMDNSGSTVFG